MRVVPCSHGAGHHRSVREWKPAFNYPCMRGDIEKAAGLTVFEPDDGMVHFARWRPLDQNAASRSAVLAPAREDDAAGRVVAADTIARSSAGGSS